MINLILSGCSKLEPKEYKTRYEWVGKGINWEMSKKMKFDYTKKWYMPNPESVPENETHLRLWDTNRSPNVV